MRLEQSHTEFRSRSPRFAPKTALHRSSAQTSGEGRIAGSKKPHHMATGNGILRVKPDMFPV